jgi:hypothetical protein
MKESQTVNDNEKLWKKRILPIDKAVNPGGEQYMEAHVKIAEGGGPLAPRIYFYPHRSTGKVYVGYFGPHRNMPNNLT